MGIGAMKEDDLDLSDSSQLWYTHRSKKDNTWTWWSV